MKYDFATILDRAGKDSIAVDEIPFDNAQVKEGFSRIPMWVADMNFATSPSVTEEIAQRLKHPVFGYFNPSDEYYESIIDWQYRQHGTKALTKNEIGYATGVLAGLAGALAAFVPKGEKVLIHAPTYIGFIHTLEDNGARIIYSELEKDEKGTWRMNYQDMEEKIQKHHIHFVVFCSPHNPSGRVWEKEEIEKAMEIYRRNDCIVFSDEIWSDLTLGTHKHIPTQSVSQDAKERTIAFYATSKTFNLSGITGAYHIVYNSLLRDKMKHQRASGNYEIMNVLSMHALIGAYKPEGRNWLGELKEVLTDNVGYAYDYITENFKGVHLSKPQGTYMLYLDCSKWCQENHTSMEELLRKGIEVGVIWQDGRPFQRPDSIRMNVALPKSLLVEALDRLKKYVF